MFDEKFCERLEYAISRALTRSTDTDWRRCWCDGILLPEEETHYSTGQILKVKEVITKAWIDEGRVKGGERGQFLYEISINFGDCSLAKLKTGDRLEDCIPDAGSDLWIALDREKRKIDIQLM